MGIVIPTRAAVTVLVLALAACAYRPGADNPVARSLTWFSYAGAGDIRAECRPGGADRLRLIYNGDYDEQVRSYDVTAVAAGGGMVEVRVRGPQDLYPGRITLRPVRAVAGRRSAGSDRCERIGRTALSTRRQRAAATGDQPSST